MEKIIDYKPKGTCSQNIQITIDQNIVTRGVFTGGCSGNTQGLGALCAGMTVDELIQRLSGIRCGLKPTSCPDQLAKALQAYKDQQEETSEPS